MAPWLVEWCLTGWLFPAISVREVDLFRGGPFQTTPLKSLSPSPTWQSISQSILLMGTDLPLPIEQVWWLWSIQSAGWWLAINCTVDSNTFWYFKSGIYVRLVAHHLQSNLADIFNFPFPKNWICFHDFRLLKLFHEYPKSLQCLSFVKLVSIY